MQSCCSLLHKTELCQRGNTRFAFRMQEVARQLQLSERMLALACAVSIDFDYFSRHSQTGAGGLMPFFMPIPMPTPP